MVYTQSLLEDQCAELSELEKRAEQASRQVTQQLICYHLENEIGKIFNSKIVSVTSFGLFCEIKDFFISIFRYYDTLCILHQKQYHYPQGTFCNQRFYPLDLVALETLDIS